MRVACSHALDTMRAAGVYLIKKERERGKNMTNILNTDAVTGFDPTAYHNRIEEQAMADGGIDRYDWNTPGLRVTRLRLLSDPGYPYWDVSYCHGTLNGKHVEVTLPFSELPKRGMTRAIVEAAKADGVYAKGLGILDAVSLLQ